MKRLGLVLGCIIGGIAVLLIAAGVMLRHNRGTHEPPVLLKPDLAMVKAGHVNLYAARIDPAHVVLFDAGMDPEGHGLDALLGFINADRNSVQDLFLTHAHSDHIAAAPLLPRARVWGGAADSAMAAGMETNEALPARLFRKVAGTPPVTIVQQLTAEQRIGVGGGKLVLALPVPGHTPGSFAYLYDGVLFVGDIMRFDGQALAPGPALFDSQTAQNKLSVVRLATLVADKSVDRVCPSHSECTPAGTGARLLAEYAQRLAAAMTSS